MIARTLLITTIAAVLVGCGGQNPSYIVGTWSGPAGVTTMTFTANADTSFKLEALKPIKGRWELEGTDLKLFRDVSDGDDESFGTQGDGAYHFTVSPDHKSLTGMPINNVPTILTKK